MSPIQSMRADAGWLQGFSLGPSTPRSIVPASVGKRDSAITRLRRRSTIVSTCSMSTGHSCMQAPQVTQSQTTSSVTAPGTSGACSSTSPAGSTPATASRRSMINSFGLRGLPVFHAGQTSWQRPHSVQLNRSSSCFFERSFAVDLELLEVAARAVLREVDVGRGGDDVQVLGLRQIGEETEHDQHVRPDEDALERLGRLAG